MPCLHDATHEGHEACMVLRDDGKWECYMCCAHLAPRDMDVLLPFHQLCKSKDKGKRKYCKTITFSGYTGCLGKAMPVSTSGQHNCSTCFAHMHSTCGSVTDRLRYTTRTCQACGDLSTCMYCGRNIRAMAAAGRAKHVQACRRARHEDGACFGCTSLGGAMYTATDLVSDSDDDAMEQRNAWLAYLHARRRPRETNCTRAHASTRALTAPCVRCDRAGSAGFQSTRDSRRDFVPLQMASFVTDAGNEVHEQRGGSRATTPTTAAATTAPPDVTSAAFATRPKYTQLNRYNGAGRHLVYVRSVGWLVALCMTQHWLLACDGVLTARQVASTRKAVSSPPGAPLLHQALQLSVFCVG